MEVEHLYIVVWKVEDGPWMANDVIYDTREDAEKAVEKEKRTFGGSISWAIVDGPIVSPETMAEAERRLGTF